MHMSQAVPACTTADPVSNVQASGHAVTELVHYWTQTLNDKHFKSLLRLPSCSASF